MSFLPLKGFPAAVWQTSGLQSDWFQWILTEEHLNAIYEVRSRRRQKSLWLHLSSLLLLGTVIPPLIRSSMYIFFFIAHTISGCLGLQVSKCCFMTPPNKKGEGPKENRALVNRSVSTSLVSMFFNQWNLRASLSSGRILTCKNAFLISPVMATGLKRPRINTLHSWFCSSGPVLRHSLRDGAHPRPLRRRLIILFLA